MAETVYILCALTSLACSVLLFAHYRRCHVASLFWCAVAFFFFMLNNAVLFVDLILVPQADLSILRTSLALVGVCLLLFGLLRER